MKSIFRNSIIAAALVFGAASISQAQVKVGDNPSTINSSAVLDVESTSKGLLPPRLTETQRNAIANPATGLVIYNTTENCLQINMGTPATPTWECSSTRSGAGGQVVRFTDKRNYNFNNGNGLAGNYTTIQGQEITVPSSSYNFNTLISGALSLTYSAFIDHRSSDNNWGHIEYRLYIDNVLVGSQTWEHNISESSSVSITGFTNVIAGAHTVELRAFQVYGSVSTRPFVIYQNSYYASIQ